MNVSERLARSAVVPVVVLDDAKDAVATANALLAGGVDVMEITFRTAAAADSIKAVAENCPDMLVGAGTVITLEQCKKAVECRFLISARAVELSRAVEARDLFALQRRQQLRRVDAVIFDGIGRAHHLRVLQSRDRVQRTSFFAKKSSRFS